MHFFVKFPIKLVFLSRFNITIPQTLLKWGLQICIKKLAVVSILYVHVVYGNAISNLENQESMFKYLIEFIFIFPNIYKLTKVVLVWLFFCGVIQAFNKEYNT